jgi:hypothetical protein
MDAQHEPAPAAPDDASTTAGQDGGEPTSARSSSEVADIVMETYARLARPGPKTSGP